MHKSVIKKYEKEKSGQKNALMCIFEQKLNSVHQFKICFGFKFSNYFFLERSTDATAMPANATSITANTTTVATAPAFL